MKTFNEWMKNIDHKSYVEDSRQPQIDYQLARLQIGYIHEKLDKNTQYLQQAKNDPDRQNPNSQKRIDFELQLIQAAKKKFDEFIVAFQRVDQSLPLGNPYLN